MLKTKLSFKKITSHYFWQTSYQVSVQVNPLRQIRSPHGMMSYKAYFLLSYATDQLPTSQLLHSIRTSTCITSVGNCVIVTGFPAELIYYYMKNIDI